MSFAQRDITAEADSSANITRFYSEERLMERQRIENNLSPSSNSNGRSLDRQNDRETSNKVLPFSIEAILSTPHPKREMPVLRKRASPSRSPKENRSKWSSPLTNLEDFTSSNLPEDGEDTTENAEIGELINTLVLFKSNR